MEYHSIRQLEELCKTEQKPVWKIVLKAEQTETDETEKQIFERMRQMYHEMKAADEGYAAFSVHAGEGVHFFGWIFSAFQAV